jgi:hypothetical protein
LVHRKKDVDARHKAGHDDEGQFGQTPTIVTAQS